MMMVRFRSLLIVCVITTLCGIAWAQPTDPCLGCHKDISKALPKDHPAVPDGGLRQCLSCHKTGMSGAAESNPFSTRLHEVHTSGKLKLECSACHSFEAGKQFGLIGLPSSWGAPKEDDVKLMKEKMASWADDQFTDSLHAKAGVDCAGCHGKDAPLTDSTVDNERCLQCHGPIEKLAARSANKEFPKRNPHASHYGSDIACTTCHHAHEASVVMCAECHKLWKLEIPGAAK